MPAEASPSRTSSRSSLLVELARAQAEFASSAAALPRLRRAPRGDGHPVLVLPGLLAGDDSTRPLRWFLRDRGYYSHGWRLGVNRGPDPDTATALLARLRAIAAPGRRVSLIGWSMGGLFALELAGTVPDLVRQVITLGSPLAAASERGRRAPVPVSALFSKTDSIVPWRGALAPPGPRRENIEVRGSHLGLGHNADVLLIVADRLAQNEQAWAPFGTPDPSQ
jgi:pimeloyl-ACP methyl ester carboxylesterase